jgi:hypothetical protein
VCGGSGGGEQGRRAGAEGGEAPRICLVGVLGVGIGVGVGVGVGVVDWDWGFPLNNASIRPVPCVCQQLFVGKCPPTHAGREEGRRRGAQNRAGAQRPLPLPMSILSHGVRHGQGCSRGGRDEGSRGRGLQGRGRAGTCPTSPAHAPPPPPHPSTPPSTGTITVTIHHHHHHHPTVNAPRPAAVRQVRHYALHRMRITMELRLAKTREG